MSKAHDWSTYRGPAHRLVVTAVRAGERLAKTADRFLKPYRLTVAQFNLLAVLMGEPAGLAQSHVGEWLIVSRANVTALVRRLKARGLVAIHSEPGDNRVKKVVVTPAGARLMARLEAPYFAEIDRAASQLRAAEMEAAAAALERLQSGL